MSCDKFVRPDVGDKWHTHSWERAGVVTKVSETDNAVVIHFETRIKQEKKYGGDGKWHTHKHTERHQKYLVVNGPLAGQRLVIEDVPADYVQYNCSVRSTRRYGWPAKTNAPSAVFVHIGSL